MTGLDNPTDTVTLTVGRDDVYDFGVGETWRSESGPADPSGSMVVTAIDREAGTITMAARLLNDAQSALVEAKAKQIDALYEGLAEQMNSLLYQNAEWPAPTPAPVGPTSAAVVAVVTTVAALEWLRHRKAAVAAAEGSDEAYRSLLSEFLIWLRRWLDGMRGVSV